MARLLDRPLGDEDLREQTERVASPVAAQQEAVVRLMLVRLGDERLALPAADVARVRGDVAVHRIPHRSGNVIRGVCNIDGEIVLAASLDRLLQVGTPPSPTDGARRTVVIESDGGRWAFLVDAVDGIEPVEKAALRPLPTTVEHALVHYARAIVPLEDGQATLLDTARLATGLEGALA
jgi:chemotaxis-related protein WspD